MRLTGASITALSGHVQSQKNLVTATSAIMRVILPVQANLEETAQLASKHSDLPAHVLKELATKSETVTPWWWGLRTLIKVHL
jgi:hypothetical protein